MKHCKKIHNKNYFKCSVGKIELNGTKINDITLPEKNKRQYKIIIDTDGDLDKGELLPFFKETGFEEWQTKYLNEETFVPLLLATILLTINLPKYQNLENYNIQTMFNFTKDLYDKEKKKFIINNKKLNKILDKHEVIKKAFKKEKETFLYMKEMIKLYARRIENDLRDNFFVDYDLGNQNISIKKK